MTSFEEDASSSNQVQSVPQVLASQQQKGRKFTTHPILRPGSRVEKCGGASVGIQNGVERSKPERIVVRDGESVMLRGIRLKDHVAAFLVDLR